MTDTKLEEIETLSKDIWLKMHNHSGRFLLPRHYNPDSKEAMACAILVNDGHARWLDAGSCFYPGIEDLYRRGPR